MKKRQRKILAFAAFSLVFTMVYGNGKGAITPATIENWSFLSNNVMKMVVNAPSSPDNYYPKACPDLVDGNWVGVPHSDDGAHAFMVTNLSYSTAEGNNYVIYVEASDAAMFFGIGEE